MNVRLTRPRTWCLPDIDKGTITNLASQLGVPVPVASVYFVRGLTTAEEANDFTAFGPDRLHDPFLLPDMEAAVERIVEAIGNEDRILIHGDGDADGICSAALISLGLEALGADGFCYVPNRLIDGFGLSVDVVDRAKELGVNLIITTDCGTEAFDAAERAYDDIHLVITDHHDPRADGAIPNCAAVVNPKRRNSAYPFPYLSGTGVALKLMQAVYKRLKLDPDDYLPYLIELVGIGTVADCVPMVGENRTLVSWGCEQLSKTRRPGLAELMKVASVRGKVDTTTLGFFISPMINAACRLAKPELALQLLLESRPQRAKELAQQLKVLNDDRKCFQDDLLAQVLGVLPDNLDDLPVILAAAEDWHPGLIGLAAGKLASDCRKPAFVCTISKDGTARGSCRAGNPNINVLGLLDRCSDVLQRYGGHAAAAGFELSAEDLPELEERLNAAASEAISCSDATDYLEIDAHLPFDEITAATYDAVQALAPFGKENAEPLFFTPGLAVAQSYTFGKNNKHLGMVLTDSEQASIIRAIAWGGGSLIEQFPRGIMVDLAHKLSSDSRSSGSLNLIIEDIRHSR